MTDLGDAMDLLNAELWRARNVFADIAPGVAAEIEMSDSNLLCYGKVESEWALYVRTTEGHKQLLHNCSRKTRIEAAHLLRALLGVAVDNDRQQLLAARGALEDVRDFNAKVRIPK